MDETTTPKAEERLVTRTIHVPISLTDAELAMRGRSLVAASRELADIREQAKDAAKKAKEQIADKELEIERITEVIESGRERRPLVCARRTVPERGVLEWVHLETMVVHEVEPLHPPDDDDLEGDDERQPALPWPKAPQLSFAGVDEWGQVHEISAEQRDQLQIAIAEKRSLRCTLADGREVKLVAIHTEDGKADGVRSPCDACGVVGGHRPDCTAAQDAEDGSDPWAERVAARKAKWRGKGVATNMDGLPIALDVVGDEHVLTDEQGEELADKGEITVSTVDTDGEPYEAECSEFKPLALAEGKALADAQADDEDAPDYTAAAKVAEQQLVQTKPKRARRARKGA